MFPLLLLGGLTLGGTALAADAAPQQAPAQDSATSAMKVAIDPVTGKRRPITEAESQALDAQADSSNRSALGARKKSKGGHRFPATQADAMANARTVNGITSFKPTLDMLSSVDATVDATGKVSVSEDGQSLTQTQELPSE